MCNQRAVIENLFSIFPSSHFTTEQKESFILPCSTFHRRIKQIKVECLNPLSFQYAIKQGMVNRGNSN